MKVWYSAGRTINLGDYNSAKVEVGAEMESSGDEERDELYEDLRDYVLKKLQEEVMSVVNEE